MFVEEDYRSPSAALVISVDDVFKQRRTAIPVRLPVYPQRETFSPQNEVVVVKQDNNVMPLAICLVGLFGFLGFLAYLASRRS
ncbi:hypothetical protein ES703_65512 [subsurface metagenome]